jgi:plastocyanin
VLLAAAGLLLPVSGHAAGPGTTHTVVMEGTRFEPEILTVRPGDKVVWINRDFFPHTATAQNGTFDSRSIAPERSWQFRPKKSGVFPYFCAFHPTMKGTLRVE